MSLSIRATQRQLSTLSQQ